MTEVDCSIPSFLDHSLLTFTASDLRERRKSGKLPLPLFHSETPLVLLLQLIKALSIIPVKDTPSSASSSVFLTHFILSLLMFVSEAWKVPRIAASLTLFLISSCVSSFLMTHSVRLQNCPSRKIISEQGLHPN